MIAYEIVGNKQSQKIAHAAAGNYKLIIQPCLSAVWQDNTRTPLIIPWTIEPARVPIPYLSVEGSGSLEIPFCAAVVGPKLCGYDKHFVETKNVTGFSVGTYKATFFLKHSGDTVWTNGCNQPVTTSWKIIKRTVELPRVSNLSPLYTGYETGPDISSYDPAFVSVKNNTAVAAGNYNMTISLVNPESTEWQDRTSDPKIFSWQVKRRIIDPPGRGQTSFPYDGLSHGINFQSYNPSWVRVEGQERTAAGISEYKITLLDPNIIWSDTLDRSVKTVPLEITKRLIPIPEITSNLQFAYDGIPKKVCVRGNDSERDYSITTLDNKESLETAWLRITGLVQTNAGDYTVRCELIDQTNTCWSDWNSDPIVIPWKITKTVHVEPQAYTAYEYGGHEITCDFVLYDKSVMTVTGHKATLPGTYTAVFTFLDPENHCWYTTGSSQPLSVPWKINKRAIDPETLPYCDFFRIYDGEYHTFFDDFSDYNPEMFTVSNNRKVKDIGMYSISLFLKNTALYRWKNPTTLDTAPVTYNWSIQKRKVLLPSLKTNNYVYKNETVNITKQDLVFVNEEDRKFITIVSGNIGRSVNTYKLMLSFGNHAGQCEWQDNPTAVSVQIPWQITKATLPSWTLLDYAADISVAPGSYKDIIVRREGNGEVTARSLNEDIASVAVLFAYAPQPYVRIYSQGNIGSTQVIISVEEGDDYLSSEASYKVTPTKTRATHTCEVTVFAS